MFEFLYLVLFRWVSGLQNGLGYAGQHRARLAVSAIMFLVLAASSIYFFAHVSPPWAGIAAGLLAIASILGALGVEDVFNDSFSMLPPDLHFFEVIATGGITLAWVVAGGDIIAIACATYPGLIVHKGFVNLGSGLPWWDERTDDPTGKTFAIPLLGIRVPRLSARGRAVAALLSVAGGIAAGCWGPGINIYHVLRWAGISL